MSEHTEKLIADLKTVVGDTEELLKATAGEAGERLVQVRAKAEDSLRAARIALRDAEAMLVERSKEAARATDDFVHEKPWLAVGIAAGVGLVVGLLMCRR